LSLAVKAQVGVETVRFYQRKELLNKPEPRGKFRYYGNEHLNRLSFIKKAQMAGFSLTEIKTLIELDAKQDRATAHQLASEKLAKLDQQIMELQAVRSALARLAKTCEQKNSELCPILTAFVAEEPFHDGIAPRSSSA